MYVMAPYWTGDLALAAERLQEVLDSGDGRDLGGPWGMGLTAALEQAGYDIDYPEWARELHQRRSGSPARANTFSNALENARRNYEESRR